MRINLTQHEASPEQGCAPRSEDQKREIKKLLTFEELPDQQEILKRAIALATIASSEGAEEAMIGGANYLILFLDPVLRAMRIQPLYAFSKRDVQEVVGKNGTLKVQRFKHLGFVRIK